MADLDTDALTADLKRDEGCVLTSYKRKGDVWTIGYGHTGSDVGEGMVWTQDQANTAFNDDRDFALYQLNTRLDWWEGLASDARRALANQCFELGFRGISKFVDMLAALERKDYMTAAAEAEDSKWDHQVPERAARIAALYRGCV